MQVYHLHGADTFDPEKFITFSSNQGVHEYPNAVSPILWSPDMLAGLHASSGKQ